MQTLAKGKATPIHSHAHCEVCSLSCVQMPQGPVMALALRSLGPGAICLHIVVLYGPSWCCLHQQLPHAACRR